MAGTPDAAYEGFQGAGGFLLIANPLTSGEHRQGRAVAIPPTIYRIWLTQRSYIAQLELLLVLVELLECPVVFQGKRWLWFTDNAAAFMALARGRSHNED